MHTQTHHNPDADPGATTETATACTSSSALYLLLVRHGETSYNAAGRLQGHTDIALSETGREQARLLSRRLAAAWPLATKEPSLSRFPIPPPTAIFSSDLSRAYETAQILREGVPALQSLTIRQTPLLRERSYGSWEGFTAPEARLRTGTEEPPDGESYEQAAERMYEAFATLRAAAAETAPPGETKTLLVVGHGGTLRLFFSLALGATPQTAAANVGVFYLGNTSLSALLFPDLGDATKTKGRIVLVNDTAHLELLI